MRRSALVLVMAMLVLGLLPTPHVAGQTTDLSEPARLLNRYLPQRADLPPGVRLNGRPDEISNDEEVRRDIDRVDAVRTRGRITGIEQELAPAGGQGALLVGIALYRDGAGAEGDAASTIYLSPNLGEITNPGPTVGERSLSYRIDSQRVPTTDAAELVFQRGRVAVYAVAVGPRDGFEPAVVETLAQLVDRRLLATPLPAPTAMELALAEPPRQAEIVRGAARAFTIRYYEALTYATLFSEAWEGAARSLSRAGVTNIPAAPAFALDDNAAIAQFLESFAQLERLAAGVLPQNGLADAAINEMISRRNDCHTYRYTAEQFRRAQNESSGGDSVSIGISISPTAPYRIMAVRPGSPAKNAGFHRGQVIVSINGTSVDGLTIAELRRLIDTSEGAANEFLMENPSGSRVTLIGTPSRYRLPPVEAEVLPGGDIGVIRLYQFQSNEEQVGLVRTALDDFEAAGVRAWVLDLRDNGGGRETTVVAITSLFVDRGPLWASVRRGGDPQARSANGRPFATQRPLAMLVNEGSGSGGELMPAALQARGRGFIVGATTAGCGGATTPNGLLDGSALYITNSEIVVGPERVVVNRVGVRPDIEVDLTPEDEEAGRDPQLETATSRLREMLSTGSTIAPGTAIPALTRVGAVQSF